MPQKPLMTIVETPAFVEAARRLMSDEEVDGIKLTLASAPQMGALMQGTGGVRKLRWALAGCGKRGGARVIYYYCNENIPLFLLFAYPKTERDDLSKRECNELRKLVSTLIDQYSQRRDP